MPHVQMGMQIIVEACFRSHSQKVRRKKQSAYTPHCLWTWSWCLKQRVYEFLPSRAALSFASVSMVVEPDFWWLIQYMLQPVLQIYWLQPYWSVCGCHCAAFCHCYYPVIFLRNIDGAKNVVSIFVATYKQQTENLVFLQQHEIVLLLKKGRSSGLGQFISGRSSRAVTEPHAFIQYIILKTFFVEEFFYDSPKSQCGVRLIRVAHSLVKHKHILENQKSIV